MYHIYLYTGILNIILVLVPAYYILSLKIDQYATYYPITYTGRCQKCGHYGEHWKETFGGPKTGLWGCAAVEYGITLPQGKIRESLKYIRYSSP